MNFLIPDKKLTDNEIKKALECCMKLTPDCDDCPYWGVRDFGNCFDFAGQDALDLINRLQAENKRLSTLAKLGKTRANDYRVMRDRALKTEAENEKLTKDKESLAYSLANAVGQKMTAKAEAYKECIEKVKEKSKKTEVVCSGALVTMSYAISNKNLDNLLKELVGDNK